MNEIYFKRLNDKENIEQYLLEFNIRDLKLNVQNVQNYKNVKVKISKINLIDLLTNSNIFTISNGF